MDKKYLDTALSIEERVENLMSQMTIEEKIHQISCKMLIGAAPNSEDMIQIENGVGQIAVFSGKKTPAEHAQMIRNLQEKVMASSRFGIPAIFHCEALSGPCFPGGISYPTSISLGASFDPEMVCDMGDRIRKQMVSVGVRQALSPVMDILRDLRWGRVNECYGNDPNLVSQMSCAFVKGLQGEDYSEGVAATGKHFLGYSTTEGGINMAKTALNERDIREVYAKPFEASIRKSGMLSVMNSYSEINGEPVCASKKVLKDLLRGELGFEGVVVSDYTSVERLMNNFHTAEDMKDAASQCLKAGLDVELPHGTGYNEQLIIAIEEGRLNESDINLACRHSLELKFKLGLFENPYPLDENSRKSAFDTKECNEASLQATRKIITMTKNDGILPLRDRKCKIAVIGPTGNTLRKMYGCYTNPATIELMMHSMEAMAGSTKEKKTLAETDTSVAMSGRQEFPEKIEPIVRALYPEAKTIYEAVLEKYPNTTYTEGCNYKEKGECDFSEAIQAAKDADVVLLTVGGKNGWGPHCTSGEGMDTAYFGLPGNQDRLIEAVGAVNSNFVVIHTDSRPLINAYAYQYGRAILEGWYGGTYAGQVFAETLCGENNPGGHLQQDVPTANGVLTYHYQQNASFYKTLENLGSSGYTDLVEGVLQRPFGYGESYTSFSLGSPIVEARGSENPMMIVSVDVENIGDVLGDTVVQLYGKDVVASVVRPYHELLGFKRVSLKPGEKKCVQFRFKMDILAFRDKSGEWICEEGRYKFFAAEHAGDESRCAEYTLEKTCGIDYKRRDFFAEAVVM